MEEVMSSVVHNRFLFSHLYLERLCQQAEGARDAASLIGDLRGWLPDWDGSSLSSLIAAQIEPTLVSLGFHYERSADTPSLILLYSTYFRQKPIALCYVAHLQGAQDSLDCTIKGRHYAADLVHSLRKEGLRWGLLTDGRRWRLYRADELTPYETFLEVDVEQQLRGASELGDAGLLFHRLFRQAAFAPDDDGQCQLDRHLGHSEKAAEGVEEHLFDCIEDVLRYLC